MNQQKQNSYSIMMSCDEYYQTTSQHNTQQQQQTSSSKLKLSKKQRQSIIALDCEMVGVGSDATKNALAKICIINYNYEILLHTFVTVKDQITDYRTYVSGIRYHDLHPSSSSTTTATDIDSTPTYQNNLEVMSYSKCRILVKKIIKNKILVGHGLKNDLNVLRISHPKKMIRDTAYYPIFMKASLVSWKMNSSPNHGSSGSRDRISSVSACNSDSSMSSCSQERDGHLVVQSVGCLMDSDCSSTASSTTTVSSVGYTGQKASQQQHEILSSCTTTTNNSPSIYFAAPMMQLKPRKLKEITKEWLGISIQNYGEEHNPFEDAYAALELYKIVRVQWEKSI
jgi:hypothetical protein